VTAETFSSSSIHAFRFARTPPAKKIAQVTNSLSPFGMAMNCWPFKLLSRAPSPRASMTNAIVFGGVMIRERWL